MLRLTTIALAATAALADPLHAIIETDKGTVKVELLLEHFPISVSNFVDLAESGWYDGQHISRVKEGEYAYFGCPLSKDAGKIKSQDEDVGNGKVPGNTKFKNLVTGAEESRDGSGNLGAAAQQEGKERRMPPINPKMILEDGTVMFTPKPIVNNKIFSLMYAAPSKRASPLLPKTGGIWGGLVAFNAKEHSELDVKGFPAFGQATEDTSGVIAAIADVNADEDAGGFTDVPIKITKVTIDPPQGTAGTCGKRRRQLQYAVATTEASWQEEWGERIECWWSATPYAAGMQACVGALGLTLASRFEAMMGRPAPTAQAAGESNCAWVDEFAKNGNLNLPQFPEVPTNLKWALPPIPRLMPNVLGPSFIQSQFIHEVPTQHAAAATPTYYQPTTQAAAQATTEEASVATTVAVGAGAGFAGAAVVTGAALLYKRATGDARLSFQKREVSSMRSPDGLSMST